MMLLRTVLGAGLAVVLGAAAMPPSTPFGERLLAAALIGGPGFVVGGLALAYVVDVQECASMSPWTIRLTTLLLGVAFGALNILLAAFVGVILLGPFWGLGAPMILRGAAVAGGVGLGLGAQIGIHGGPR
jgi:hypothetical protein